MTDQELKEIAENTALLIAVEHIDEATEVILKALTQVRDAHSCSRNQRATQFCQQAEELAGKLAILEANEAVQNALITDLKNKVELAVDVLERIQYLLGEKDFDLISEALEKIKEKV